MNFGFQHRVFQSAMVTHAFPLTDDWYVCMLLQLGRTPLHLACEKGHIAAAAALVTGGADLLAKDRVSSGDQTGALD